MRVKNLLTFFFAVICFHCVAQYQQNLPQAKPIPPNAAAMFKVLEKPLGTYTGTVPINFPLCNVSSGSLSANVGLNYNSTGGIRVEELASCVGLGFSLSDGGGRITQMVRGKPDDQGGILNGAYEKPSSFSCSNRYHLNDVAMDLIDLEPDIFLYSFNGHTGKFFFKEDKTIVFMGNTSIKITYDTTVAPANPRIRRWIITDENGNKYYFGQTKADTANYWLENASSYSSNNGSGSTNTSSVSWYLTEVWDMNEENSIRYSYIPTYNTFTTISGSFMPINTAGEDCQGFNTSSDVGTVTTDGTEYLISRIDGNSGYIIFNSVADYNYGPKKITSIVAYDSSGNFKKKYNFNYGTNFSSNRWKLANFSEFGCTGTDSLTHSFQYDEFNNLPEVLSPSVDVWGYYNGNYNYNTGLIPNIIYNNANVKLVWDFWADRTANGFYGQANILTQINYPTGSYRQFIYEGNKALPLGNFFIYQPDPAYMVDRSFTETNFHNYLSPTPCLQHLFTVRSSYGLAKLYFNLDNVGYACNSDYTVNIMRLTDSTDLYGGYQVMSFNGQSSGNWVLDTGYYRIDVFITNNNSACTIGDVSGSWKEGTVDTATVNTPYGQFSRDERNAGGVRVKEIRDYDPITGKTNKRQYKYQLYSSDSTVTSGMLATPVDIVYIENISSCGCSYFKLYPGSSYPLASEGGSYVVYPQVRTIDSANGWTDDYYSYQYDLPPSNFPMEPPYDYSYARGKLLSEKIYDNNGSLLKKTVNSWDYGMAGSGHGIRVKPYWYITVPCGWYSTCSYWTEFQPSQGSCNNMWLDCMPDMGACTDYYIGESPVVLWKSIDSIYGAGLAQEIKTDYRYYVQNGNFFPQQKISSINNKQTKEQTYKYAFNNTGDFKLGLTAAEQAMKDTLLNRNYLMPLEVVDSIKTNGSNPVFLSGAKFIFGTFNTNKLHLSKYRAFTTATDSTEINFSGYDARGNLAEQYKTNDIKEVTLWGYRGMHPVAKVIGSNYATVAGFVDLSVLNNPSSDGALRTELNKIRTGLAGSMAQVTTYTYSPLYGMTSMTDPAGRIIYYEYDAFGRLIRVRDQNNNILKKYDYKMNNPQ